MSVHNSVPPDPTMTVDGVTQVFNKIKGDKAKVMRSEFGLHIPSPLVDEIMERSYSTESEKNRAFADVYINIQPNSSWEHLTHGMYWEEEFASARESKSFISTGKYYHILVQLLCSLVITVKFPIHPTYWP